MKLHIPKPCHEDWNKMKPEAQGRFCSSCEKTVVDFTNWSATDIQNYFTKHYKSKPCGRFKHDQLTQPVSISIPHEVFYTVPKHRRFLFTLFIVFGTTLFSCTDFGGNRQMIGEVVVTPPDSVIPYKDSTIEELSGEVEAVLDSVPAKPLPHKVNHLQVNVPEIDIVGVPMIVEDDTAEKREALIFAEIMPSFPGGNDSMLQFISRNLYYPATGYEFEGRIIVQFVVGIDGSLKNIEIKRGMIKELNDAVIDMIQKMPKWSPGVQNGKNVEVKMILPVRIELR